MSIVRSIHPYDTHLDDVAALKPVPRELLDRLKDSNVLKILECDWWAWKPLDLKEVLEDNPELEEISIVFDAPFSKLFALGNVFANMLQLRRLRVSITPRYAPGVPVGPSSLGHPQQQSSTGPTGLITPASSPVTVTHGFGNRTEISPLSRPSTLSLPASSTTGEPLQTPPLTPSEPCPPLGSSVPSTSPLTSINAAPLTVPAVPVDPSLPSARDVLKFARRCPKLDQIDWYGRNARGTWLVQRDPSPVSSSLNSVRVDFIPPSFACPDILERAARERDAQMWGWTPTIPRMGHEWTGSGAEAHNVAVEKEKEAAANTAAAVAAAELVIASAHAVASATAATTSASAPGPQASPKKKHPALTPISTSSSSTAASGGGSSANLGRRKQPGSSASVFSPTKGTGTAPAASRGGEGKRGEGKDKRNGVVSSTSIHGGTASAVSGSTVKPDRKYYKTDIVRPKSGTNIGAGGAKSNGNVNGNSTGSGTGMKKTPVSGVGSSGARNRNRRTSPTTGGEVVRDASGTSNDGGVRRETKVPT